VAAGVLCSVQLIEIGSLKVWRGASATGESPPSTPAAWRGGEREEITVREVGLLATRRDA
jgi:hypothetical protein